MCVHIINHRLTHDRRPLYVADESQPSQAVVNPYTAPVECRCGESAGIAKWLECKHHDCCRVAKRVVRCSSDCDDPVEMNWYEGRTEAAVRENQEQLPAMPGPDTEGWHPLPVVDADIFGYSHNGSEEAAVIPAAEVLLFRHYWLDRKAANRKEYAALKAELPAVTVACIKAYDDFSKAYMSPEDIAMADRVLNPWEWSIPDTRDISETTTKLCDMMTLLQLLESQDAALDEVRSLSRDGYSRLAMTGLDAWD